MEIMSYAGCIICSVKKKIVLNELACCVEENKSIQPECGLKLI